MRSRKSVPSQWLLTPARLVSGHGRAAATTLRTIDGVDTDFYLRARDLGLACVVAPGTRLEHRLGQAIALGEGRELPLLVASTFRYHYQWRNLVALLRRHARRHPAWAVRAVVRAVRHLAIVTVLAPGRLARLREAYAGLRAGLRGETGARTG